MEVTQTFHMKMKTGEREYAFNIQAATFREAQELLREDLSMMINEITINLENDGF